MDNGFFLFDILYNIRHIWRCIINYVLWPYRELFHHSGFRPVVIGILSSPLGFVPGSSKTEMVGLMAMKRIRPNGLRWNYLSLYFPMCRITELSSVMMRLWYTTCSIILMADSSKRRRTMRWYFRPFRVSGSTAFDWLSSAADISPSKIPVLWRVASIIRNRRVRDGKITFPRNRPPKEIGHVLTCLLSQSRAFKTKY